MADAGEPDAPVAVADERGTAALAEALAARLRPGDVVELVGELGAGKTAFVRAACRALGVAEAVTSPTFAVAHRYAGAPPVSHLDLYRATAIGDEELADLDPYLDEAAIVFVEWPEVGRGALPAATWRVELAHAGGERRRIRISRL